MAWIEVHQALAHHHKLIGFAKALGVKRPQALGHLVLLWLWALDNAPSGDLTGIPQEVIAEAAMWPKSPVLFMEALTGARFVDVDCTLHDWWVYAGRMIGKRAANAQRMRDARAAHVQGLPTVPYQPTAPTAPTTLPHPSGEGRSLAFRLYEGMGWTISPNVIHLLDELSEYEDEWLASAFEEAAAVRARNLRYVTAILEHWRDHGRDCECGKKRSAPPPQDVRPVIVGGQAIRTFEQEAADARRA